MKVINKLESYPTGDMIVPYCPNCDNPTYSERKCPFCNTELEYDEMIEKDKEIEKLKEVINGMIENEEKYNLEIIKLKSIIKEVREYITNYINQFNGVYPSVDMRYLDLNKILEILNKENK